MPTFFIKRPPQNQRSHTGTQACTRKPTHTHTHTCTETDSLNHKSYAETRTETIGKILVYRVVTTLIGLL